MTLPAGRTYRVSRPLYARDGVTLDCAGSTIHNDTIGGPHYASTQCVFLGALNSGDDWPPIDPDAEHTVGERGSAGGKLYAWTGAEWRLVGNEYSENRCSLFGAGAWYPLEAVDVTRFAVGDVVCIADRDLTHTTDDWMGGTTGITPYLSLRWSEINVVESVEGGVLTFRRPLRREYANAHIRNCNGADANTDPNGERGRIVRDFTLKNARLVSDSPTWGAITAGGAVDCRLENCEFAAHRMVAVNAWAHCEIVGARGAYTYTAFELAYGCHNVSIEDFDVHCSSSGLGFPVAIQATSEDCVLRRGTITTTQTSPHAVVLAGASDRFSLESVTIDAPGLSAEAVSIGFQGSQLQPADWSVMGLDVMWGKPALRIYEEKP